MNKMILVETHIYSKNHADFKKLNNLCFLSKNLYNSALFIIRQEFFNSGHYLNYYNVNKIMHDSEQIDYKSLPSQISQQTLKLVDQNFKSFFKSIKDYSKYPNKYKGKPKLPKYLDKLFGRQVVHITKQYIKRINKNEIYIKCFDLKIKTRIADISYIKIIPINKLQIKILVGYEQSIENNSLDKNKFAAIDLGINNLATITFNDLNKQHIIINGKPLKSIIKINADVNGSLNIMRKYFNENETRNLKFKNFKNLVEGLVLSPLKITA